MAENSEPKQTTVRREVVISVPALKVPKFLQGFTNFVREQGVIGLAVGFVLGAQVKVLVDQLVTSFISPLLALALPGKENSLVEKSFSLSWAGKTAVFTWGAFAFQFISFLIVALVVYEIVHLLKLDRLDKKKS